MITYSVWILVRRNIWIILLKSNNFRVCLFYDRLSLYSSTGLELFLYPSLPSKSSCFCHHVSAAISLCITTPGRLLLWLSSLVYFLWNNSSFSEHTSTYGKCIFPLVMGRLPGFVSFVQNFFMVSSGLRLSPMMGDVAQL